MQRVLGCLGACLTISLVGCADAALREKNSALEKENQELRAKLEQAHKEQEATKVWLALLSQVLALKKDGTGTVTVPPELLRSIKEATAAQDGPVVVEHTRPADQPVVPVRKKTGDQPVVPVRKKARDEPVVFPRKTGSTPSKELDR